MDKKLSDSVNYSVQEDVECGSVKIADEVVSMIAGLAACEVEGVAATAGNVGNDLLSKVGITNNSKGVKVDIAGNKVAVAVSVIIKYGFNIPAVSSQIQEKVKGAIENMTGLEVTDVDIKIAGVDVKAR